MPPMFSSTGMSGLAPEARASRGDWEGGQVEVGGGVNGSGVEQVWLQGNANSLCVCDRRCHLLDDIRCPKGAQLAIARMSSLLLIQKTQISQKLLAHYYLPI